MDLLACCPGVRLEEHFIIHLNLKLKDLFDRLAEGAALFNDGEYFVWPSQFATWTNNAVVEYYLDTSLNTYGYSISRIDTYGGWNDSGRDAQQYSIYCSVVGSDSWILLGSIDYNPAVSGSPSLSRLSWSTDLHNVGNVNSTSVYTVKSLCPKVLDSNIFQAIMRYPLYLSSDRRTP